MNRRARLPLRPRHLGLPASLCFLALFVVACGGGGNPPPAGGPQAVINSPLAGSLTAGTFFFSVQALDPAEVQRVTFRAGQVQLGADSDPSDGFRVFVTAADHPAGALSLEVVVTGKDGRNTTLTRTVTNVPQPPASTTVGTSGAALGTREVDGSLSTLVVPPGTATGAAVEFLAMNQDEVAAATGVVYDDLGITFLGAQDIVTTAEFDRTPGVSSGGFGPAVQPGQTVVNYLIGPDEDGDGVGEVYVVNTASVAPNGDVISDPIPIAQVGRTTTVSTAGSGSLVPSAAGLSAPPGALLEIPVAGFNPSSLYGNLAVFNVGGKVVERFGRVVVSASGAQTFVVHVPPLTQGTGTLTLSNLGRGYASEPIGLTVQPQLAVSGSAATRIESTLSLAEAALAVIDARLAGTGYDSGSSLGRPFIDLVRANVAIIVDGGRPTDLAALESLAARIDASGADALFSSIVADLSPGAGIRASQQGKCNDILDRADKGINAINDLTDLAGYSPGGSDELGKMHGYAFGEWWSWVKNTTLGIDRELGGNACRPPPPNPPGPGTRATPSGMGAAVPAGGNVGGSVAPPDFRPIPDYSRGIDTMATALQRGRFLISISVAGSAVPFKSTTDAGGYFMVPMVPTGEPFTAVALDTVTGENRVAYGVGPALGAGFFLAIDFGSGASEYTEARWDGDAANGLWLTPRNWEGDSLPLPNSNVIIPAGAGAVILNNYSDEGSKVLVNSITVATGATLELAQGTLELVSDSTIAGHLYLNDGSIRPQASLTMTGPTTWYSGGVAGGGTLVNRGTMTLSTEPNLNSRRLTGRIENHGTVIVTGLKTNGLTLSPTGSVLNAADGTFEVQGVPGLISSGGATVAPFDNLGTVVKSGAGQSDWTGAGVNHLGGTVNVQSGTLQLAESSASTGGTWTVASGAVLALGWQTRVIELVGTYTGSGAGVVRLAGGSRFEIGAAGATFDFPNGGVQWTGAAIAGPGTLRNDGVMVIVNDNFSSVSLTGHLDNRGTLTLGGTAAELRNSGGAIIDNAVGASFLVYDDQGVATANDPLTFRNAGAITKVGGTGTSTFKVCFEDLGGSVTGAITFAPPATCSE